MTDDTKPRYGSVYARGYNDGLRAAGVANPCEVPFVNTRSKKEIERVDAALTLAAKSPSRSPANQQFKKPTEITQQRFLSVFNGLSAVLKHLYECVPISEKWTAEQVSSEFARKVGSKPVTEIKKLLNSLDSNGLIVNDAGLYRRVIVSGNPSTISAVRPVLQGIGDDIIKAKPTTTQFQQPETKASSMDILARIAANARTLAGDIKALANDIDEAALEIEQEFQNSEAKSEQLKQLKSLLKNITD